MLPVREAAQTLLDAAAAVYAAASVPLPDRVRVAAGDPREVAWDCEQVTAGLVLLLPGQVGQQPPTTYTGPRRPAGTRLLRTALLELQVVRCHPEDPDDTAALTAAGVVAMSDAALIVAALTRAVHDGIGGRDTVAAPGEVGPLGPSGGYVGTYGRITVTVLEPAP